MIGRLKRCKISTNSSRSNLKEVKVKSFSVEVMYKGYDISPACDFPHRLIWNLVMPPKMRIFTWEAIWGKILTLDNLKR